MVRMQSTLLQTRCSVEFAHFVGVTLLIFVDGVTWMIFVAISWVIFVGVSWMILTVPRWDAASNCFLFSRTNIVVMTKKRATNRTRKVHNSCECCRLRWTWTASFFSRRCPVLFNINIFSFLLAEFWAHPFISIVLKRNDSMACLLTTLWLAPKVFYPTTMWSFRFAIYNDQNFQSRFMTIKLSICCNSIHMVIKASMLLFTLTKTSNCNMQVMNCPEYKIEAFTDEQ